MYIRFNSNSCKTLLIYLISFVLIYTPTLTHAQTVGGWTVNNVAAQGAKAVVSASQNVMINGKEYIKKGTALVAPTASQVSKVLARGGAAYALSFAVEQLLGSVDWLLDPANNEIKYYPPNSDPADPNYQWLWNGTLYNSPAAGCRAFWSTKAKDGWAFHDVDQPGREYPGCIGYNSNENRYDIYQPVQRVARTEAIEEEEQKTLPLDVVSQQVISNAENGNTDAQAATVAAAQDIVNDAEKDDAKAAPLVNQFENSATTENADAAEQDAANSATGQTKPNTETGGTDLALEFPAFCGWAPTVCQAAQVVISFPQKLENWYKQSVKSISEAWASVKEWSKGEEITKDEEKPEIKDPDLSIGVTNYIQFGSQCPVDRQIPLSMGGQTLNLVISYQPLCTVAQQFRPAVILMAFLAGAFIITNTGRRAETGD